MFIQSGALRDFTRQTVNAFQTECSVPSRLNADHTVIGLYCFMNDRVKLIFFKFIYGSLSGVTIFIPKRVIQASQKIRKFMFLIAHTSDFFRTNNTVLKIFII